MITRTMADGQGATHAEVMALASTVDMLQQQRKQFGDFLVVCLARQGNAVTVDIKTIMTIPRYRLGVKVIPLPQPHKQGLECRVFFDKPASVLALPESAKATPGKIILSR